MQTPTTLLVLGTLYVAAAPRSPLAVAAIGIIALTAAALFCRWFAQQRPAVRRDFIKLVRATRGERRK